MPKSLLVQGVGEREGSERLSATYYCHCWYKIHGSFLNRNERQFIPVPTSMSLPETCSGGCHPTIASSNGSLCLASFRWSEFITLSQNTTEEKLDRFWAHQSSPPPHIMSASQTHSGVTRHPCFQCLSDHLHCASEELRTETKGLFQ